MKEEDKQTLLRSGVQGIGKSLQDIAASVQEVLDTVSKEMDTLQGNSLFLGEASTALLERFTNFKKEFPRFVKEIENYALFMDQTLISYQETDDLIEVEVGAKLNSEIETLSKAGNIAAVQSTGSGLYDVEVDGSVRLNQLHPTLNVKMSQLVDQCKKEGIDIRVTASLRSSEEQDALYNQGRTSSGSVVTNKKGSDYSSLHQWGTAFDVAIQGNDPYNKEKLAKVGEIGKSLGLEWGGDWEKFPDMPHFQLSGSAGNTDSLKNQYETPADFADTWIDETI